MKRLRVALETQFAHAAPTGLGVYARGLAAALGQRADIELVTFADPKLDLWRFDRRLLWDQVRGPLLARRAKAQVVHFTGGTLPLWTPHPCVLTLHDLAWVDGAVSGRLHSRAYFGALQRQVARRADRIATDSDASRARVVQALGVAPSHVAVTGAGIDESWFAVPRSPADPPFFLSVGTVEERKDLVTAVRALALLPGHRLVSVGPHAPYARRVRAEARAAGVEDRVELRGFVDDATLEALYAQARALVFPSRYEGFGLPPLQALAAKLPVVASDIPVLREVLGDCALYARPGDPGSFADGLRAASRGDAGLRELTERGQMHARGFTWNAVAERMVGVYRAAARL